MSYIKEYVNQMTDIMMRIYPDKDREIIKDYIKKKVKKNLINPIVNLDNNVTHENVDSDLLSLTQWIDKRKPVVSGNATFYKQPKEQLSPTANMLRGLKKDRKAIKKEMFSHDPSSDEYAMLDLDQQNTKVVMNAEYGGSGTKTAAFYTKWSPPATTLLAQSIITTIANLFESIVGDNNKFMSLAECFDWMNYVLNKNIEINNWIIIPDNDKIKYRIKSHFYQYDLSYSESIDKYIDSLNDEEKIKIYYANNLHEFIKIHESKIGKYFINIMNKVPTDPFPDIIPDDVKDKFNNIKKYQKHIQTEMFMNPYEFPKNIEDELNKIGNILFKYIYVPYITPDSIEKLNHHKRKTVMLVDTDSNVLYLDKFVQFIKSEICYGNTFGRLDMYNDLIIVNICASFLSKVVADLLDLYGRKHNMDEESRAELTMKNEFLFRTMMLFNAKKAYMTSIVLREGNLFNPFKTDIKGAQFIKSAVSKIVSDRFTKIAEDNVLFSDQINLKGLIKDVKIFEKEIIEDMKNGGITYLKMAELKERYSDPWRIQIYKASIAWNTLYPDDIMYPLDKGYIVKLGVNGIDDLNPIKDKYPEIYNDIVNKIFNSPDPNIQKYGLSVIAVPTKYDKLPEWITELMDIELLCSNIIDAFKMVLDAFRNEYISINTPTKKINKFTNFVKF